MTIQQIADNKWTINNGHGTELTLVRQDVGWAWGVIGHNTRTRASRHNRFAGSFKGFNTLADVEANYKSFRGISQMIAA